MSFSSLLSLSSPLSAQEILTEFKALNDPAKIMAFSDQINGLKTAVATTTTTTTTKTTSITPPPTTSRTTSDLPAQVFSEIELEMLMKKSFQKESGQEEAKRPCVDFDPCKHGTCHLENDTMQFSCICNLGYMVNLVESDL